MSDDTSAAMFHWTRDRLYFALESHKQFDQVLSV